MPGMINVPCLGLLALFIFSTLPFVTYVSASQSVLQKRVSAPRSFNLVSDIREKLTPLLSAGAVIIDDGQSAAFEAATERWQLYDAPEFAVAVEAANENDVIETIKYANQVTVPFLVRGGGHGAIKAMADFRGGIQISMPGLKSVVVNRDGTASVGGGARTIDVISGLFAKNRQTVTGTCECTGVGALLGGGHGYLQGRYGLAIDNMLQARVVLGNGTLITTNEHEHADLFWALRGAGHNFAAVTEVTYRTYAIPRNDSWYHERWVYKGPSVEAVFKQFNLLKLQNRPELVAFVEFSHDPAYDPVNAILTTTILFNGPRAAAEPFVAPFRSFNPVYTRTGNVAYDKVASTTDAALDSVKCTTPGINRVKNGIYLDRFNITSQRQIYDLFNNVTNAIPSFRDSGAIFDLWPAQAPSRKPRDSTAMPWRDLSFLVAPVVVAYRPDPSLDQAAEKFIRDARQILHQGSGLRQPRSYINYAFGDESLESLYGGPKQVARLRRVKHAYDPNNNFRFFGPGFA